MKAVTTFLRRGFAALSFVSLLVGATAGPADAQQIQGSIIGQVVDESGSVLPGVTVTASSPALQTGSMTVITDAQGDYRLTPLPLGVYVVVYTLPGFQTLRREELRLPTGFVAREDVQLKVGSLEESVTVSGAAPVVDVSSTAVATQFTRETLEITPTGRNGILSLASQIPGVRSLNPDVGGNLVVDAPTMVVNGQPGDSWINIEGVVAMSPKETLLSGAYYDYAATEEVRSEIVTTEGDVPMKGLKMSIILKSGGNQFHGSYYGSYTNDKFQSSNINDELRAVGITAGDRVIRRYDISGDFSGRLIPNKLWFYMSTRTAKNVDSPLDGKGPDGIQPAIHPHEVRYGSGKLSYQLSPANKIVTMFHWNNKIDDRGTTRFVPWESRTRQNFYSTTTKAEWQYVRGNSLIVSAQFGFWDYGGYSGLATAPIDKVTVRTLDIRTQFRTGSVSDGRFVDEIRYQPKATMTWYKGSHELKGGTDFMNMALNTRRDNQPFNYELRYDNGVPFQILTSNGPTVPKNPVHVLAVHASDSWSITRQLTLKLAGRFSHENAFVAAQCRGWGQFAVAECYPKVQLPIFSSLSPRLHAAYDVFGDAKSVLKGGWTRYYKQRGSDEPALAALASPTTTTWLWHDLNGDRQYQPGEVNLNPNGSDFVSIAGGIAMVPNPDEVQEKTDELSIGFERQLTNDLGVRVFGMYSRNFDLRRLQNNLRPYSAYSIPITNRDPGFDGVVGNADDPGTFVTYYDYPTSLRGRAFEQPMFVLDPSNVQKFKTIEVAAIKRMSNKWQLLASYSATRKDMPYAIKNTPGGDFRPLVSLDPNAEINTADQTWDWQGKVSGAYQMPYGLMTSVNYQIISGEPWARQVLFRGGVSIPSLVVRVEPIGARRLPAMNLVDARVEKTFRMSGSQRIQVRLNLFNLFNANTVQSVNQRAGPDFGRTTGILPPRIVVFSVGYDF
jgi:hypothetical protein